MKQAGTPGSAPGMAGQPKPAGVCDLAETAGPAGMAALVARAGATGRGGSARVAGPVRRGAARLLVRTVDLGTRWLTRLLGVGPTAGRERISEAELRDLVAANTVLDGEERRLIAEVLAIGSMHVSELMVPRTEVVFLDAGLSVTEAVGAVKAARHSRFPVTDGSPDDVIGFVHLRDLLVCPDGDAGRTLRELIREVRRLPASKRVLAALSEMRRAGDHLAVVVDEYGGTAGIVTLEDLIEELVGEIHDEYDAAPEPAGTPDAPPTEVDGLLNLADLAERAGLALPPGPYETLGGFVMARLGKLPAAGDEIRVDGWRLVVRALDGRRVARVTLCPPTSLDGDGGDGDGDGGDGDGGNGDGAAPSAGVRRLPESRR